MPPRKRTTDSTKFSATDLAAIVKEAGEDVAEETTVAVTEDTVRVGDVAAAAVVVETAAEDLELRNRRGFDPVSASVDHIVASLEIDCWHDSRGVDLTRFSRLASRLPPLGCIEIEGKEKERKKRKTSI